MAKGNKGRGNRYELECRKLFRSIGYTECETSRYASRKLDDAKVDLTDTGRFNVQCKHYETPMYYYNVLPSMPDDDKYNIILHKIRGKKQFVVMTESDWEEIMEMLKANQLPVPMCEWTSEQRRYDYSSDPVFPHDLVVSHYHKKSDCNFAVMKLSTFVGILKTLLKNNVL